MKRTVHLPFITCLIAVFAMTLSSANAALVLKLEARNFDSGIWLDSSGNNNHANPGDGAPVLVVDQTANGSSIVRFDGNDSLNLTSSITSSAANGFTALAFVRPDNTAGIKTIVAGNPAGSFQYRINGDDTQGVIRQSQANLGSSGSSVPTDSFSNINAQANDVGGQFRTNGVNDGSITGSSFISIDRIGRKGSGAAEFFSGDIAEIRIYDEQLSAAAIQAIEADFNALYVNSGPAQYAPDANTLHLWHLDESSGPALPDPGISGSFNLTPVNGATLNNPGFPGFGTAGNTGGGSNQAFQGADIPVSAVTGANGAFTFEALVNLNTIDGKQGIIMMDANGGTAVRPFQFAIQDGELLFLDIVHGVQRLDGEIPTTGDHAFVAGEWFHVAATYNGDENTADNFKLYWTALNSMAAEANEISSGNLLNDLAASAVFGVGNEFRAAPGENLEGFIDEVRISNIARGAGDFMFAAAIPEPTTATLGLIGMAGLMVRRRRAA